MPTKDSWEQGVKDALLNKVVHLQIHGVEPDYYTNANEVTVSATLIETDTEIKFTINTDQM